MLLQLGYSALESESHSVRAITGSKFRKNALDMAFYRMFRDREFIGYKLVGIPTPHQPQHFNLSIRQTIFCCMICQVGGYL